MKLKTSLPEYSTLETFRRGMRGETMIGGPKATCSAESLSRCAELFIIKGEAVEQRALGSNPTPSACATDT